MTTMEIMVIKKTKDERYRKPRKKRNDKNTRHANRNNDPATPWAIGVLERRLLDAHAMQRIGLSSLNCTLFSFHSLPRFLHHQMCLLRVNALLSHLLTYPSSHLSKNPQLRGFTCAHLHLFILSSSRRLIFSQLHLSTLRVFQLVN